MSMTATITKSRLNSTPEPGVPFLERREGFCKRPLGTLEEPPKRFCGAATPPGSSYCPDCQKIIYSAMAKR